MVEDLVDKSYGGHNDMIKRTRMRLEVVLRTRGEMVLIIFMIRTLKIREEEVEEKDLEKEASVGNVFTVGKKVIENLNVLNTKDGQIEEQKARQ